MESGSSSTGFQSNKLDLVQTVNQDIVKVFATKICKIGIGSGSTSITNSPSGVYIDNSSMNCPFYFNYGKYVKTALKFNDSASNVPENTNLWLIVQCVNADGSATAIQPAEIHWTNRIEYEDA